MRGAVESVLTHDSRHFLRTGVDIGIQKERRTIELDDRLDDDLKHFERTLQIGRHGMLNDDDKLFGIELIAFAEAHENARRRIGAKELVVGRTAGEQHAFGMLAHGEKTTTRALGRADVIVSEFDDRVSYAVVDRSAHFAAFEMNDAVVHERGARRESERVEAIAVDDEEIGLDALENVREFDER